MQFHSEKLNILQKSKRHFAYLDTLLFFISLTTSNSLIIKDSHFINGFRVWLNLMIVFQWLINEAIVRFISRPLADILYGGWGGGGVFYRQGLSFFYFYIRTYFLFNQVVKSLHVYIYIYKTKPLFPQFVSFRLK